MFQRFHARELFKNDTLMPLTAAQIELAFQIRKYQWQKDLQKCDRHRPLTWPVTRPSTVAVATVHGGGQTFRKCRLADYLSRVFTTTYA